MISSDITCVRCKRDSRALDFEIREGEARTLHATCRACGTTWKVLRERPGIDFGDVGSDVGSDDGDYYGSASVGLDAPERGPVHSSPTGADDGGSSARRPSRERGRATAATADLSPDTTAAEDD